MKMKKTLSIAMALVLAVGMLAGCGAGGSASTKADISAFVDTDENVEITWLGYPVQIGCEEGKPSELIIEEKFNVSIKPLFLESAKYNDKKNAFLQSGDIPDMIYEMDPMYVFADARDEFLLEVPYEAIYKYAPSLYKQLNEYAPDVWSYSNYEGKNYGLPNLNRQHISTRVQTYRGDWLKKLGFEVPETLDELHDVLYAFVHNDPDGNGKDDTYGYVPHGAHYQWYFSEIFGAYGVLPFDWQEVDGEIVYGGFRPEVTEVLSILNSWWEEGLIYPAFVEADKGAQALFLAEDCGYIPEGSYIDLNNPKASWNTLREENPEVEYAFGTPVKGPDGLYGTRSWGYPCHIVSFGAVDENSPVKATRILKMLEGMYTDDELLAEVRFGKIGDKNGADVVSYLDETSTRGLCIRPTEKYEASSEQRVNGYTYDTTGPTFWTPFMPSEEFTENYYSKARNDWYAPLNKPESVLVDRFYKVDIVPSAPTYIEDMRNGQMTIMGKVIKGELPVDKYMEEFQKIWDSTGGSQMLKEAKEQLELNNEIIARVNAVMK